MSKGAITVTVDSTKRRLAAALKKCTETTPLNKITIEMIAETAQVTRNTFHYHFSDLHDLLAWTLDNDVIVELEPYTKLSRWQDGYRRMLDYVALNRHFCLQCFRSLDRQLLEDFLVSVARQMVQGVVRDAAVSVDEEVEAAIMDFYGGAIVMQLVQWLATGLQDDQEVLYHRAEIGLDGAIENAIRQATKSE